jgi:DNA gyrase/topoisomerase IV subunit A
MLEAVVSALEQIDTINGLVDRCEDRTEAVDALAGLGYDKLQSNAILDITVGRRTARGREDLANELRCAREFLAQFQGE